MLMFIFIPADFNLSILNVGVSIGTAILSNGILKQHKAIVCFPFLLDHYNHLHPKKFINSLGKNISD
jgi:hypothetical protein